MNIARPKPLPRKEVSSNMSANIYYKPVKPTKSFDVPTYAPQDLMKKLEHAFGKPTPTLDKEDLPVLTGLSIGFGDDNDYPNPYKTLIKAINKYGAIELEVEY